MRAQYKQIKALNATKLYVFFVHKALEKKGFVGLFS